MREWWGPAVWSAKLHGGPYQVGGLPDLVVVLRGRVFFIELKRPGERPTPRQGVTLARIREAGAGSTVLYTNVPFETVRRVLSDAATALVSYLPFVDDYQTW